MSWEPADRDNVLEGARLAFGEAVEPQYRFENANVILSLEADFVANHPASLRLVREFAGRRKTDGEKPEMNRLYVVEASAKAYLNCLNRYLFTHEKAGREKAAKKKTTAKKKTAARKKR